MNGPMMISLAAAGLLTGAQPDPAQGSSEFSVSFENEVQNAIVPAFERYTDCTDKLPISQYDQTVDQCADIRKAAISEAISALAKDPAWADPAKIEIEVNRTFDTHDENQRKITEAIARARENR